MVNVETIAMHDPAQECMSMIITRLRDWPEKEDVLIFLTIPLMEELRKFSTEIDVSFQYDGDVTNSLVECRRFFQYANLWFANTLAKSRLPLYSIVGMQIANQEKKTFKSEKLSKIIIFDYDEG